MANYRERIEAIEKEITANEALIRADHRAIGKTLVEADIDLSKNESVAEHAQAAAGLSRQIAEIEEKVTRVQAVLAERAEDREAIEAKEAEIRTHQESLPPIYEEIGKVAFERFRESPFVDQEYAQIFSDLVKHHEELRDVETELERLDASIEQKPFLEKVVARGKRIVLANRLSAKQSTQQRLFRKVGKDVTRTEFIQSMDDATLSSVAKPYYDTEKQIEDLTHDVENLRAKEQKRTEELTELVNDQRPDRYVTRLQSEKDGLIQDRDAAYTAIGNAVALGDASISVEDANVSALVEEISELERDNQSKRATISRLQAALRVIELDRQIDQKADTIDALEKQIENIKQQIAEQNARLEELKQEKAEQEKARGPEDTL